MGARLLSHDSAVSGFMLGTCHPKIGLYLGGVAGALVVDRLNAARNRQEKQQIKRETAEESSRDPRRAR
jgi:hypothetical protein